jgi:hypothetical protein
MYQAIMGAGLTALAYLHSDRHYGREVRPPPTALQGRASPASHLHIINDCSFFFLL